MCDRAKIPKPRARGKPKRFLWPNKAGPPCRARAPARDAPPGRQVWVDALREHIPRLNSPPNPAETVPKPIIWLIRAGPPMRGHPPWWDPLEHIPRLKAPPGEEGALNSA